MSPLDFIHCVVCLSNYLLLHVPFQLHFRLNLFSLNVLFALKNITQEIGIVDYISSIILGVGRRSGLVGVCNVKFGNPLPAAVSLAPN